MATLHRHKGIVSLHKSAKTGATYAICGDGKVLIKRWSHSGWKLADARWTPEIVRQRFPVDNSAAAKARQSRANAESRASESCKLIRRLDRALDSY